MDIVGFRWVSVVFHSDISNWQASPGVLGFEHYALTLEHSAFGIEH
jgi:hypothetical protein